MRLFVCCLIAACFSIGCAEPNTLTGSIEQSHDLTFDSVSVRLLTDQQVYEIKYLLALEGGGDDVVAKVVFNQPTDGIVLDEQLDLLDLAGKVERITAANDPFPGGLEKANATFTAGGTEADQQTTGEFATTFDNGKTLNGTFDAPLEVVAF